MWQKISWYWVGDGHIIESIPEMVPSLDPVDCDSALEPSRNRQGAGASAYASDYPHEVDLVAAKQMIHETVERADLSHAEKAAVLGENAKRFFRL